MQSPITLGWVNVVKPSSYYGIRNKFKPMNFSNIFLINFLLCKSNLKKRLLFIICIIFEFIVVIGCTPEANLVWYDNASQDCVCYPKELYRMCYPEWLDGYGTCILKSESCPDD